MRVGIDIRCFSGGKNSGVEEYTKNFLRALFVAGSSHEFVLFFNAYKDVNPHLESLDDFDNVTVCYFSYPNKLLNMGLWYLRYPKVDRLLQKSLRAAGQDDHIDAFFVPNQTFVAFSPGVPWVMTVHDLSAEHYTDAFSWKQRAWHYLVNARSMTRHADHIVAVSEATRTDLIESYGIPAAKITTILSAPTDVSGAVNRNSPVILDVKARYDLPRHFFLYFGTIEPRKNIVTLIEAFDDYCNRIVAADSDAMPKHLILAGNRGWHPHIVVEAVKRAQHADRIRIIYDIPSEDREALFVLADVFVYPSHFEGFGFPPLEALMTGTPVITSHTSSLPEVVGRHGILIDPTRKEELAEALYAIAEVDGLAEDLVDPEALTKHFQKFSWNRAAETDL